MVSQLTNGCKTDQHEGRNTCELHPPLRGLPDEPLGEGNGDAGPSPSAAGCECNALDGKWKPFAVAIGAALAPSGGSCTPESAPDPSKVTSDAVTICAPSCAADVCAKKAPAGFRACVVAENDVACDLPGFGEKILAGVTTSLSCGACTSCTATAACTNVSVDLFTTDTCTTAKVINLPANACTPTGPLEGTPIRGILYNATATPAYDAPPSAGTASVVDAKTICCAP